MVHPLIRRIGGQQSDEGGREPVLCPGPVVALPPVGGGLVHVGDDGVLGEGELVRVLGAVLPLGLHSDVAHVEGLIRPLYVIIAGILAENTAQDAGRDRVPAMGRWFV